MILETFTDLWNYTFLIYASIAVIISSIIVIRKMKKEEAAKIKKKRLDIEDEVKTN